MDINAAKKFLSSINLSSSESPITHIGFSGGEPFLFPEIIEAITKKSVEKDLLFDCIMTNGVWWKNQEELKSLRHRWLHLMYVPIAANAVKEKYWAEVPRRSAI